MSEDRICRICKTSRPDALFPSASEPCVYCLSEHREESQQAEQEALHESSEEDPSVVSDAGSLPIFAPTTTTSAAIALQELAQRKLARKHLLPFVERFNPKYLAGWVHKDICRRLEKFSADVAAQKSPRLMLFMPPRHGKSTLASISFPAWHLGGHPDHEIISCSYSGSLAMSFSRKVRNLLREPGYATIFPNSELDPDSQSAESWLTTKGGGYVAAGVGGGITGKGAHVLIIDDPVKNQEEAESDIVKEQVFDWYTSTAYTRLAPGGGVLLIMTRWTDDDLGGKLIEEMKAGGEEWEIVKYPAIAEEDELYRDRGQALHIERYDIKALQRIQRAVGPRVWSALYQQNPVPDTGDYFTINMIKYYNPVELDHSGLSFYQAWDLAIGKDDVNDFTAGVTVGVDRLDNMYIVDMVRAKMDGYQIVEKILDSYELWKPQIVGIEKGHIEMAIGPFLSKRVRERQLHEAFFQELKTGRRDKRARARAIQGRMQQGKVFFPKDSAFGADLIAEMLRFPNGNHDDQVDAVAWIGLMMTDFTSVAGPAKMKKKSWRERLERLGKPARAARSAMGA